MELMTTIKHNHDNGRLYFQQALTSSKSSRRMAPYESSDSDSDSDIDAGLPCAHLDRECTISVENFDERNVVPPILTSPRSIEACRMLGLETEDLVKRPIEYFLTRTLPGHPPATTGDAGANNHELATKRAARYEKNRQIQLKNVRAQRHELIDAELSGFSMHSHDSSSSAATREFTVIKREKRELERMQQRRLAEMQQMLAFELQMTELHRERERKEREKERHDEQLARERTRRQREADEMKRRRELEKAEQHKLELELVRKEANETQAEILLKEQRAKKEEERRHREVLLAEKERQRKQDEARLQAELYQLAQVREVEKKEREIARREEQRRHQLEYKKRLKAMEIAEKQERNKIRITSVLDDKELMKEYQRQEAERKHQLSEERRQQFENERRQREHELRLQAQRKEEAIDLVQHQLQFHEERRRARLIEQEQEAARRLEMREIKKQVERERQKLEEQRQEEEIQAALARKQKQDTYRVNARDPHSAIGLHTRSWTDCDTSTHPERAKSAKRPMSAIGRPGSGSTWKRSSETSPQHRNHTDTEGSDDSGEDGIVGHRDNMTSNEHDANIHNKLEGAILRSEIDALRRKHNEELLRVLEEEHHAEEQREHLLQQATHNGAERARMETISNKERTRASERIMEITQRHERALASRIDQLHSGG
ncbi:hypothetical protein FI667_g2649, partial [Globisporangium splendens]